MVVATRTRRPGRTARILILIAAALGVVLLYTALGIAFAAQRIDAAERTLGNVVAHQNSLNKTLNNVDATFSSLSSGSNYNPVQAKAAVDLWLSASTQANTTIERDNADLASATNGLRDARWLTALSHSNLEREETRLGHARDALASALSVTSGYLQDGQFWESFIRSTQDLDAVITASGAGDWATARSDLTTMKADVDTALQASSAPGLPPELHSVMADFQVFAADYGRLVDASQAGDDAGVASSTTAVQADAAKLGAYNFDQIILDINAYYKPLIDRFNSQMALATR